MQITLPKTVFVADDDPDARSIVAAAMEPLGCTCVEAQDGSSALELLKQIRPDLVILDQIMPGACGTEICKKIKQSEEHALVPVLILTAQDQINQKVHALQQGADDYLTKPFNIHELRARAAALLRIRELLENLQHKNIELAEMQSKLIEKERQLAAAQIAGTAAHQMGQPISAVLLNCHILETVGPEHTHYREALEAIKKDAKRLAELLKNLKLVNSAQLENYYGKTDIIKMNQE